MTKPRLSMKLLVDWLYQSGLGDKDKHTVRVFLQLVENRIKSLPATQHSKKRVKNPLASQKHNK